MSSTPLAPLRIPATPPLVRPTREAAFAFLSESMRSLLNAPQTLLAVPVLLAWFLVQKVRRAD